MIYLLAKYTILFLLATLLGFALGYWWSRRNFMDVSESYEDLRKATERTDAANWSRLWERLDALPQPKETDLAPVIDRVDGVRSAITGIPKPAAVDLAPVENRFAALEKEIRAIPAPTDIGPLNERVEGLETMIRNIPVPKSPDLQPVRDDLFALREQISGLPKVETHQPVSLTPLANQVDALEKRIRAIPQPDKVDLQPIDQRLRAIESAMGKIDKRLARPAKTLQKAETKREPRTQRSGQPRILSAALYGKKDDLKLISGVGPKLEGLLNTNGVFYFWQVASWSRKDIETIDQRLDSFKGRISRDDWVSQARQLKRLPDAARMPAE